MNKSYNKANNKEALKSLMRLGLDNTKILIMDFMNEKERTLNEDEGLILSLYLNYYIPETNIQESINSFIGLIFYRGLKNK